MSQSKELLLTAQNRRTARWERGGPGRRRILTRRQGSKLNRKIKRERPKVRTVHAGYWSLNGEVSAREETRILFKTCKRVTTQRSPLCSPTRTAIKWPGFEIHSHRLGSNPVE